jgi:hypothetical protein
MEYRYPQGSGLENYGWKYGGDYMEGDWRRSIRTNMEEVLKAPTICRGIYRIIGKGKEHPNNILREVYNHVAIQKESSKGSPSSTSPNRSSQVTPT